MVAHVGTVAFLGLEARTVDVQVQIAGSTPNFNIVGLPDKAVKESRERVQATLDAIGLSLPPRRITVNLSPAKAVSGDDGCCERPPPGGYPGGSTGTSHGRHHQRP